MKLADLFERFFCGLKGHATVKAYDAGRVYLSCMNCGFQSVGWDCKASAKKKIVVLQTRVDRRFGSALGDLPRRAVGR